MTPDSARYDLDELEMLLDSQRLVRASRELSSRREVRSFRELSPETRNGSNVPDACPRCNEPVPESLRSSIARKGDWFAMHHNERHFEEDRCNKHRFYPHHLPEHQSFREELQQSMHDADCDDNNEETK